MAAVASTGCGAAAPAAQELPPTAASTVPPSSASPTTSAAQAPSVPTQDDENDERLDARVACSPSLQLIRTTHVVRAKSVAMAEPYRTVDGAVISAISVDGLVVDRVESSIAAAPSQDDPELTRILATPVLPLADDAALEELESAESESLLFLQVAHIDRDQIGTVLVAGVVDSGEGGAAVIGPECAAAWTRAADEAAQSLGRTADLDFYAELVETEGTVSRAVFAALDRSLEPATPPASWWDLPPAQRSLSPGEIPIEAIPDFELVGVSIEIDPAVPDGVLWILSDSGVVSAFATKNVSGVLPMFLPRGDGTVALAYSAHPDSKSPRTEIAVLDRSAFDAEESSRLVVGFDGVQLSAEVSPLMDGELETITGLSSSALDELRQSYLAGNR